MDTAKVFWSGRSQAVRLPKGFRFDCKEVRIRKHGTDVILEPMIPEDWGWLDALIGAGVDFPQVVADQPAPQERPTLDTLFR